MPVQIEILEAMKLQELIIYMIMIMFMKWSHLYMNTINSVKKLEWNRLYIH